MRKLNHKGFTRYERQRMAFLAGVLQAVQEKSFPMSAWYYKPGLPMNAYNRGLSHGRQVLADLLERVGY